MLAKQGNQPNPVANICTCIKLNKASPPPEDLGATLQDARVFPEHARSRRRQKQLVLQACWLCITQNTRAHGSVRTAQCARLSAARFAEEVVVLGKQGKQTWRDLRQKCIGHCASESPLTDTSQHLGLSTRNLAIAKTQHLVDVGRAATFFNVSS